MKKPKTKKELEQQAAAATEYDALIIRSGLTLQDLASRLKVRYECLCKRRKGRQTITQEATLALRMLLVDMEHESPDELGGLF